VLAPAVGDASPDRGAPARADRKYEEKLLEFTSTLSQTGEVLDSLAAQSATQEKRAAELQAESAKLEQRFSKAAADGSRKELERTIEAQRSELEELGLERDRVAAECRMLQAHRSQQVQGAAETAQEGVAETAQGKGAAEPPMKRVDEAQRVQEGDELRRGANAN